MRLRIVQGSVDRFAIQYETLLRDGWAVVVRYDSAHGYAHRDLLDASGNNVDKLFLGPSTRYAEIVSAAIDDIKLNWPDYRRAFTRRRR